MIVVSRRSRPDDGRHELDVRDTDGDSALLWYELDGDQRPPILDRMDVAALALLPRAMNEGVDLHIEGRVDRTLLDNLDAYQRIWTRWRPLLFRHITISADELEACDPRTPSGVAALAFSGGVDSCYTLAANSTGALESGSVDIAVAVVVHGFDVPVDDVAAFAVLRGRVRNVLSDFGTPAMYVRTNWRRTFCPHWTMSFMGGLASVLHLFADRADVGLVSSEGVRGKEVIPWGSNSITNPLLASSRFALRTAGLDIGRTDRCRLIASWPSIRENVRVCGRGGAGANCGACGKCIGTKLHFVAAGLGDIPALGPLSVEEVRAIPYRGAWRMTYHRDILRNGELPPELRAALRGVIRRHWWRVKASDLRHRVRLRSRVSSLRRGTRGRSTDTVG